MQIRIGEIGRILAGEESGNYVKVLDDTENTGGYLILTAPAIDMRHGYDNWVESKDALARYFEESGWTTEWL
ncbi:MAG: hypothetical protein PHX38_11100 [Sulfuricella sp.]|nr:hypothetical protein [Sulfuricella sp.]